MEPGRNISPEEIKKKLENQLKEIIGYLQLMQNGEGSLYKTTMTVDNLGKIDVYHYVYFLVQHARRHIVQMKKIETEFETRTTSSSE